jgi:hypothetical protein
MPGVVVNDGIWIGGADGEARAPGVNNGAKALELVAAGGTLVLTGDGIDLWLNRKTQTPRMEPETKDAIETAIMAL